MPDHTVAPSPGEEPDLPSPAAGRDGLAVVDAASRALAAVDLDDADTGYENALRILAEGFDARMVAIVRFDDEGAYLVVVWTPEGLVRDPQLRVPTEFLPGGAPLPSASTPVVLKTSAFGGEVADLLAVIGGGDAMLTTPIVDADEVSGCVALMSPDVETMTERDRVAIQLCGELLWRHMRHHDAREELHRRAEVAEILADVGGRLHEGGVAEARELLDDVFAAVGRCVDAVAMRAYEIEGRDFVHLLERAQPGHECRFPKPSLTAEAFDRLAHGGMIVFDELRPAVGVDELTAGFHSGAIVPGIVHGELVGLFVVGRTDNRPLPDTALELITGAVGLLGQFRVRMGAELDLVRRGVVEQARTEIAESFLNTEAAAIDATAVAALERLAGVFGARRVRWVEATPDGDRLRVALEWADGSRPEPPTDFEMPDGGALLASRDPVILQPEDVSSMCGVESSTATLVVPTIKNDEVQAVLTLTGDRLGSPLPDDELRALTDLAGVILQARERAARELEQEYRQSLDDLQLRLAHRFLDRTVTDAHEVLDWMLGEVGTALGADLIAFAEYVGSSQGTLHWWSAAGDAAAPAAGLDAGDGVFDDYFAHVLRLGEPDVVRSRRLPDDIREAAEAVTGTEFSLLVVPFRAPGIALLLGVCAFGDREFTAVERALLLQVIGQLRQFIDVVAGRVQLEYDATHDALTGLANRRMLTEEFDRVVGDGGRGAVLMIDVDRFKVVNDSLGHSAGDAVLVAIADRIQGSVRGSDLVGRFGGDEFAVMIRDGISELELGATAHRLIEVIREPILVRGTTVIPTCSVGIATSVDGDDVEAVLRHADAALYDAKAKGRDRYEFFDDARRQSLRERLHLETSLRRGVSADEFEPWFQPEYDLVRDEIVGVEALVRWNHPTHGVLDASRFIDAAEEIGLAPELSRIVVKKSFATLRGWLDEGFDTRMRVNVAAAQLQSGELAAQIHDALDEHSIPAESICIEITERSLMLDPDSAIEALGAVRDLGVEVAVDDFGTGFSSLARLKYLPVDTLKIDRSFVNGIVDSSTDREIVRTIVWLSRGLGLDVVAEGVEAPEQVEMLLELGCRRAQGWLWSPAVPADDVPRLARV